MREARHDRKTTETRIKVKLNLDGTGKYKIDIEEKFFKHMIELFAKHGLFDIEVDARSLDRSQHHLVEDVGIALGKAFNDALGEYRDINRSGYFVMPMDDSLAIVAVDLGGRPFLNYEAEFSRENIEGLDSELIEEFLRAFANNAKANIHVILPYGKTDHHRAEAIFKAFGKAMMMACSKDKRLKGQIPSTKLKI